MFYIRKQWMIMLSILIIFENYLNIFFNEPDTENSEDIGEESSTFAATSSITFIMKTGTAVLHNVTKEPIIISYYKYPLLNSSYVAMDYSHEYNSSYYWFMSMKPFFKNTGDKTSQYFKETPVCQLNEASLGPIKVNKTKLDLRWVEEQNLDVKLGGYYAPAHCRAAHRVAILVSYRDRKTNLIIFLHYIHLLLKKQLLEYRIFVIEQFGTEKFNKGTLYNIGFLETQRFGTWHCLIFHDVDLIPEDERILYSCPENPTHMSSAVETYKYALPYDAIFGGVTALTPEQYTSVNGYSNCYWNWGGEDDDIRRRLLSKNYTLVRYNVSIARFATLPHPWNDCGKDRKLFLMLSRFRFQKEGLKTTKYKLIKVTEEKLYTHILADVNPTGMKLDTKSLMLSMVQIYGKSIEYDRQELQLRGISAKALRLFIQQQRKYFTK